MTTFHNSIFSTNDTADDLKRVSSFAPKIKVAILTNEQPNESHLSTATIVKALRQRGIELVSPVDDDYTHFPESEEGTLEAVQKGATDILWMNNKLNDEHPIARLSKSQTLPNEVTIWGVDVSSQKAIDNESYIHKWLNSESQYQPNLIRRLSLESDGETVVESDESESYSFSSKASSEEVITTHVLLSEPEPEPEPTVPLTISQQLAKQVCSLRYEDLPTEAIQNTKILILDTVGCALAGSKEPVVETLLSTPGFATPGSTPLIGRSEKLDPLCAALINGVSAHALDFDDVNVAMGGHAAAPILPTLFSLASTHPCSGKDLITAFIAGFEVETKLAKVVNDYMYVKGFHPTSVLGVFGSTAAACSLLRLSEHETSMALGLAASMASGIKANFGSMSKSFHIGAACKDGLSAALLASKGFTSSIDAFESSQGFLNVYNGEGNYDLSVFDKDVKKSVKKELLHIVAAGAGIKLYPCCDSTHCSIDSILTLKSEHNFNQDDISSIEIQMNPKRLKHVNKPVLKNSLDCKFSVQYNISRAIIDSEILLSSFSEDKYQDERVLNLMDKVTTMEHTELWKNVKGNYLTTIKVGLKDGRVLVKEMVRPKGRSREDPASHSSIKSKFFGCSSVALNKEESSDLYEKSMSFEHLENLDSYLKNFSL